MGELDLISRFNRSQAEQRAEDLGIAHLDYRLVDDLREAIKMREKIPFQIVVKQPAGLPEPEPYFVTGITEARDALALEIQRTSDLLSYNETITGEYVDLARTMPVPSEGDPVIRVGFDGYMHEAIQMVEGADDV